MTKRFLLGTVAAIWAAAWPAPAPAGDLAVPTFWIAPGAGVAWPPAELGYGQGDVADTEIMFGGLLGVKLARGLALEGRGHYLSTDELADLEILRGEGNLTWQFLPDAHFVPFVTAGAGIVRLKDDSDEADQFAWNAGGGVLLRFTDGFGLRVDARRVSYEVPDGARVEEFRPHTEIFAGLSFSFGGTPPDTDRDGVPDRKDRCLATPLGARVDAAGCPTDGDGDGVLDGLDKCPDTPAGARVDQTGCPGDTDGDGVLDGLDRCPNTAQGVKVDAEGCGLDADGDGVFDGLDQCPDTPPNARVDADGCPIVVTEKETELLETGMIRLEDVNFDLNRATIKPESHAALDEVGDILSRWPQLRIEVGGHTDSQGSEAHNQKLSEERASAVLDYLLANFRTLKSGQLTSAGYGESAPVAPNDTALSRAKNRRVEFKVLNTEALKRETEKTRLAPRK